MDQKKPVATIKDVARLAGVSTATVSATLNDTAYVSPELRERVLAAVGHLGYAPSAVARSLRVRNTKLIGLVVADITNPFFTELVRVMNLSAQRAGYSVVLFDTDHSIEQEKAALRLLETQRVDGIILAPTGAPSDYATLSAANGGKPLVMVDRIVEDTPYDLVSIDNRAAAFEATEHILSFGHKRVAILAGAAHLSNTAERLEGFREALAQHSLAVDPGHVIFADYREDKAYEASLTLLSAAKAPTAIFVSNNLMLIGLMRAISELKLSCPRDVSVAAIDDFPWAGTFTPRLTTVRQPIQELGEAAMQLLLDRMASKAPAEPTRIVLPASLIVRDSCARRPRRARAA